MRYLILLDRKFPFRSGESFLENEIREVAGFFDCVVIYPNNPARGEERTRQVSSKNVKVRGVFRTPYEKRKIGYGLKALSLMSSSEEKGPVKRALDGYFMAAAKDEAERVARDLERLPLKAEDELYFYSYWFYVTASVACLLKKHFQDRGIRAVAFTRAHRFDIYEEKRTFGFLPQRRNILSEVSRVYACSDDGTDYLKERYPEFADKIETSYLGTYDHGIGADTEEGVFSLVSCSRVTSVKRVGLIVDALAHLSDLGLKLRWTHIGDGPELEDVKRKAKEKLGFMEVVFTGALPNTEVYDYYSSHPADLFINVSSSEGLPVSIMEAISFGIPTVATDVGGTSEIVRDGITGRLLKADFSPSELAEEIRRAAVMEQGGREALRQSTRTYWEKHFQAEVNYENFARRILELTD